MKNSKNIILYILIGSLLAAAIFLMLTNSKKRSGDIKLTYEKNVETLKKYLESWENEDTESINNLLTEDYELLRYPIMKPEGDTIIKRDFINFLPSYFQMVDSTRFDHTIYLPGVDSTNCFRFDGSVRIYSSESFYVNKKQINMSFYGTYNFKNDSICKAYEFFDISGVSKEFTAAFSEIN